MRQTTFQNKCKAGFWVSLVLLLLISIFGTGVLGGAETYSQTREYAPAIRAAGMSAVQGAIAPITSKLGLGADLTANTVCTVALGKLEGNLDDEIFQDVCNSLKEKILLIVMVQNTH